MHNKSHNKLTSEKNLLLIERTTNIVKDIKESYENEQNQRKVTKKRSTISSRSISDISKLLMDFKNEDAFSGTTRYETKLERMINTLTKIQNKLIFYQDISLAEEMTS